MFQSIVSSFNKFLLFGLIGFIFLLFDWYAWQALRTLSRDWTPKSKQLLLYSYWSVSLFYAALILLRPWIQIEKLGNIGAMLVQVFGVILFIAKVFVILPLLIEDLYRLFEKLINIVGSNSPSQSLSERRKFISVTGLIMGALPLLGMSWGVVKGAHNYRIRKVNLKYPQLPPGFEGVKIVQLSDIHSGSFWDREAVMKGIQKIKDLQPDIIVFTGDLVNNTADEMLPWKEAFASLSAPLGIYSVLGNHDYGDYVAWPSDQAKRDNLAMLENIQKEMGWRLLKNEAIEIEKEGDKIRIIGVENWSAKGRFPRYGKLKQTLENNPAAAKFTLLLSHDPSHWKAEVLGASQPIDLTLSGHTHGFQFGIETHGWKWSPVKYMYPEWAGLYQSNARFLYVNRGFGYIGYPGRLGIDPEITLITLNAS